MRVAALYDVHGMLPALEAVLHEIEREDVDLLVFGGDATWGPWAASTAARLQHLGRPARFVQGNAELDLLRSVAGEDVGLGDGGRWIVAQHDADSVAFLRTFEPAVVVDVDGLGPVRFVHGSPRSVIEIVTPETPLERLAEAFEGVPEATVVSGHCHLQFDRPNPLKRSLNPGSIGLPYHPEPGACWALLGPDVQLRLTPLDRDALADQVAQTPYPDAERIAAIVRQPPTVAEVVEHGERLQFSG
jgi:predicted phosphodiesterase